MNFDLRFPMGLMFTLMGVVLAAFGVSTRGNAELYAKSLGVDANFWWGAVLFLCGLFLFARSRRREDGKRLQTKTLPQRNRRRGR